MKPKLNLFPIPNEQLPNTIDDYFNNVIDIFSE